MADREPSIRRPWRPRVIASVAIPLLLVLVLAIADQQRGRLIAQTSRWYSPLHFGLVIVSALAAVYAVSAFARALGHALEDYLGLARARATATFLSIVLYCVVILIAINSIGPDLSGLLVGGALTGVVVGIAGQASLSNIIAGLLILFTRPYQPGMYVTVRAGVFGGVEYSGRVWDISLFYTTLHGGGQEIRIPNSTMVAAVVVLRPRELDIYIPVTLPPATDLPARLEALRGAVAGRTGVKRTPHVILERVTELGYVVSVRVFVTDETERQAVERAIAGVVRENQQALAGPLPAGAGGGDSAN